MEIDKLKQWMDMAQKYQADHFWKEIFEEKKSENKPQSNPFIVAQEFAPKCDLYEFGENLIFTLEIPGLRKEDLRIAIHEQNLKIEGEFKAFHSNSKYFIKERPNRKFIKEISIPLPIQLDKINSELNNGILTIIMPVNKEEIESIPITIENNNFE